MCFYPKWMESVRLTTPAAASPATRRIPSETYESAHCASVVLTTSAVVANRYVQFEVIDGDSVAIFRSADSSAVVASTSRAVFWDRRAGADIISAGGSDLLPLSDALFPPGFTFRISVAGMQAGDQLALPSIYVERFPSARWADSTGATPYRP